MFAILGRYQVMQYVTFRKYVAPDKVLLNFVALCYIRVAHPWSGWTNEAELECNLIDRCKVRS